MSALSDIQANGLTLLPNRGVLRLEGPDREAFLQGLVTNNVAAVTQDNAVYACLLTPQGKFLHDFFLVRDGESLLIECEADRSEDLLRRLKMYKLRAKITLSDVSESFVACAAPDKPEAAFDGLAYRDPRLPALGYRLLPPRAPAAAVLPFDDYDRRRIALGVPDGSRDMEVGKAILLENNIDLLNGVAWDKGCYTGQELTARTHYRGLIKKRLSPVRIAGTAPAPGAPLIENGVEIGEMRSANGDLGLALLKLDIPRRRTPIVLEDLTLTPEPPDYLARFLDGIPA
jgi:folate-binding protein YgfZ